MKQENKDGEVATVVARRERRGRVVTAYLLPPTCYYSFLHQTIKKAVVWRTWTNSKSCQESSQPGNGVPRGDTLPKLILSCQSNSDT